MKKNRAKKGFKILLTSFIVILLMIIGLFALVYSLISDADKKGNMMDGTWNYSDKQALVIDIENKTYSLDISDIHESGKLEKVELIKDDYKKTIISYTITLSGSDNHVADIRIDYSDDKKDIMEFKSEKYNESFELIKHNSK